MLSLASSLPGGLAAATSIVALAGAVAVLAPAEPTPRCASGQVLRHAAAHDNACVSPEVRARTRQENQLAALRRSGDGCRPGFVRREAFDGDRNCVPPAARDAAGIARVLQP